MAFDLLIKNGTIVDGTGRPGYRADLGVMHGRVAEIGKLSGPAARTIDASDLIVAPGIRRSAYALRCPDLLGSPD